MHPATLRLLNQMVTAALRELPLRYYQAFMDGVFQVTPQEEQFASQVLNQIVQGSLDAELVPGECR